MGHSLFLFSILLFSSPLVPLLPGLILVLLPLTFPPPFSLSPLLFVLVFFLACYKGLSIFILLSRLRMGLTVLVFILQQASMVFMLLSVLYFSSCHFPEWLPVTTLLVVT